MRRNRKSRSRVALSSLEHVKGGGVGTSPFPQNAQPNEGVGTSPGTASAQPNEGVGTSP